MKVFLKKLLVCTLIFLMIFNFMCSTPVQASTSNAMTTAINWVVGIADGILGIISYLYRIPIVVLIIAVMGLMTGVASVFGYVDSAGNVVTDADVGFLGPDDIFFNKLLLTDANVFRISSDMDPAIIQVRQSVALWYYVMRVIAISILLGILIYIAIRMAIATVASEKASYKKMLVNWASSIGLVFLLHYLIVGISYINSTFIDILYSVYKTLGGKGGGVDNAIGDLVLKCLDPSLIVSQTSIIVVVMLIVQTLAFLIYYVKRMLTISFLIIISPLITITYSIDKLGDGKAQALNTWLKEYFFTVIIQPFHCIIYMAFVSMSISLLTDPPGAGGIESIFGSGASHLIAGILSVLCIKFIWDAEKIVKNIFGIKVSDTLGDAVTSAAVAGAVVSKGLNTASKAGSAAKNISKTFKSAKGLELGNKFKNTGVGRALTKGADKVKASAPIQAIKKTTDKINNTTPIRKMRETGRKVSRKVSNVSDKVSNVVKDKKQKIDGFLKTESGMKFKRRLATSAGVAASMIGGAAAYGSSAKTSLFEAGVAGYGSYKGVKSMALKLMNTKKENYTDGVQKSQETMANIRGEENTGDKDDAVRMHLDAARKDKEGELSNSKIGDKEKEAREKIRSMLKLRDGYDKGAKNPEIDKILSDIQNGIFLNNLDMDEIAKKYKFGEKDGKSGGDRLREATGDFAEAKLYKQMAQDNKDLDELAGEDGYYKMALAAWAGEKAFDSAVAQSQATNPGPGTQQVQQTSPTSEPQNGNTEPIVVDFSEGSETLIETETSEHTYTEENITNDSSSSKNVRETAQQEYFEKVSEMNNTWNEIHGTSGNMEQAIQNQNNASEMAKQGEFTSEKIAEKRVDAMSSVQALLSARDGKSVSMNDPEIARILGEVLKGVRSNSLELSRIANDAKLNESDLRKAVEDYADSVLGVRMARENENLNSKVGDDGFYQEVLKTLNAQGNGTIDFDKIKGEDWTKLNSKTTGGTVDTNTDRDITNIREIMKKGASKDGTGNAELDKKVKELEVLASMDGGNFYAESKVDEYSKIPTSIKLENGDTVTSAEIEKIINEAVKRSAADGSKPSMSAIVGEILRQHGTSPTSVSKKDLDNTMQVTTKIHYLISKKSISEVIEESGIDKMGDHAEVKFEKKN